MSTVELWPQQKLSPVERKGQRISECCHKIMGNAAWLFHYLTFLFLLCLSWESQLQHFQHSALSQSDSHCAGCCLIQALSSATIWQILALPLIAPKDPQRHNQCWNFLLIGKRSSSVLMVHGLSLAWVCNFFLLKNIILNQNNCLKKSEKKIYTPLAHLKGLWTESQVARCYQLHMDFESSL